MNESTSGGEVKAPFDSPMPISVGGMMKIENHRLRTMRVVVNSGRRHQRTLRRGVVVEAERSKGHQRGPGLPSQQIPVDYKGENDA